MSKGVNKVTLLGHLGGDPEMRRTAAGEAVANFSLATGESWTDKQTGERTERTEWHRVVLFARTAEVAEQYLHKGSQVYIEGRLQTDKYTDREGNARTTTKILARELVLLAGKPERTPAPAKSQAETHTDFDDDIPF